MFLILVSAVNTWAVSLLRYSAAFISWRKCELQAIDMKIRKLLSIHGGLHPKSDFDRLYIPRKNGRRGLIAIQDCVGLAVRGVCSWKWGKTDTGCWGRWVRWLRNSKCFKESEEREEIARLGGEIFTWPVSGQTKEVRSEQSRVWL